MIRLLPLVLLVLAGCTRAVESAGTVGAAAPPDAATTVYLVRHAEKADDGTEDPPLTEVGAARAQALADSLGQIEIDAIFVSSFQRTGLTAQPLAARIGLAPVVVPAMEGSDSLTARTARQIRALPAGSRVLVVGHSNTIGPLVEALGGPPTGDLPDCQYDSLFEVTMADSVTFDARTFGPASEGEACEVPEMVEL